MKEMKLTTDQLYEICNKVWIQAQRKYYEPLTEKGFRFTYNEILKSLEQEEDKKTLKDLEICPKCKSENTFIFYTKEYAMCNDCESKWYFNL
jgi:DNA-directed RNA polymerase subunit F